MPGYSNNQSHTCGCIGPQNGEPLCPCRMRGVTVQDGRYVEIIDHGPVPSASENEFRKLNMAKYAAALLGIYDKGEG